MNSQSLGKLGEDLACEALRARDHAILATRHRTRFGEIDIVSEHHGVVVFVEVKARRSAAGGESVDALTPHKQRRIAAMALDYLAWTDGLEKPCRFDVVAIDHMGTPRQTLRIIEDAWHIDW